MLPRPAVAAVALLASDEVLDRDGLETRGEVLHQLLESGPLLLPGEAEVPDAYLVGGRHLAMAPNTGVLARIDRDLHAVPEVDGLAARDADHLLERHPGLFHDPDGLVAADDLRARVGSDPLRTVEVVEVRVPDDDPVALFDEAGGVQAERCATVPVECRRHGFLPDVAGLGRRTASRREASECARVSQAGDLVPVEA
jgi:hypothetical protein